MMFEGVSPKDCLTIVLVQKSFGSICLNRLKMNEGDLVVIDDAKAYDFVSSHHTKLAIVNISKALVSVEMPWLLCTVDQKFEDRGNILSDTIEREWDCVIKGADLAENIGVLKMMEKNIIIALKNTLAQQKGEGDHLTKGETIAFDVKVYLLNALEEDMTVQSTGSS